MAETTETVQTTTEQTMETNTIQNPFGGDVWTEALPEVKVEETASSTVVETTEKKDDKVITPEVKNEDELKKSWHENYGWQTEEDAKTEIESLRKLKEAPPEAIEYKFENDESKKLAEAISKGDRKTVLSILETQEKIEALSASDINDNSAEEILKLSMQLKSKNNGIELSKEEINYKYNKEFGIPKEPVRRDDELDSEFEERQSEWKEKVADIKMNRNIEAKLAKPELENLKTKLVLPEANKPTAQANEPTQEQLDAIDKARKNFLSSLESNFSKADGFNTKVKDESVEIPISFKIPDEEKVAIKGRLQEGLDINSYMDKRWFDESGNAKIEQIVTDLYQLENLDKIISGIANNSANERIKEYRKQTSNVDVKNNGNSFQQTFDPTQNGNSKPSPFATGAWSEKPPLIQN